MVKPGSRLSITILLLLASVNAATQDAGVDRRAEAEGDFQLILQDIAEEQQALQSSRRLQSREQSLLKQVDLAIRDVNERLSLLQGEQREQEQTLASLEQQREVYLSSLDDRLAQLAEQVRAAYRSSGQSRARLLLNQDDPSRISRLLAYYDQVNRARLSQVAELRQALTRLEELQRPIDARLARIAELSREQQAVRYELDGQRDKRHALLEQIARQIDDSESRIADLEQNRSDLQNLLDRLSDVLSDIPENLEHGVGVASRKGQLQMPVDGPVRHAFGQDRGAGLDWQGWLIGAQAGAEVAAVAYGRVAFADWLRGYGLLVVIDHGDDFMTLYGHNESLLHEAGEWVDAGEPIGVVGSNPGSTQGAYFEIRRAGRALDPAAWLAR